MKRYSIVGVIAVVVLLGACGSDATTISSTSSLSDASQSTSSIASAENAAIDDFTSPVVGGGSFVLSKALADKPVVLWFWAPG